MIVYGWIRPTILLALKNDLCATCNVVGQHAIVRRVSWISIFFVPVLPIWLNHRLVCGNCGAETKLGYRQVRAALKSGKLPLGPRPGYPAYAQALFDANERRPAEIEFDPIEPNPKRGGWHAYTWVWSIGAGVVVVLLVATAMFRGPSSPVSAPGGASPIPLPTSAAIHDCWLAPDGSINGCRMHDGSVIGYPEGSPIVCFFNEPLPTDDYSLRCRD